MLQAIPHHLPASQPPLARAGVSLHHPFLQRALEPEALVSEQFITHQPVQHHGLYSLDVIFTTVSPGVQPVSTLILYPPHPHSLSRQHQAWGAGGGWRGAHLIWEREGRLEDGSRLQASGASTPVKRARRQGFWSHYMWLRQEALHQDVQGSGSGLGQ